MKKTLLTIALLALAATGQAQFVVSMYLNGTKPTASSTTDYSTLYRQYNYDIETTPSGVSYTFTGFTDSTATDQELFDADKYIALGGGAKIGYQVQRLQFGISGTFNWYYTHFDQNAARYLSNNPDCDIWVLKNQAAFPDSAILENYVGWFKEYYTSWSVAPYIRYELVQTGDLALFIEANGFFAKVNEPQHHDYLDWTYREMHGTIDTSFAVRHSTTSYGVVVIPGFSWQLSPHCLVDLYFDCLALGYRKTRDITVTEKNEFDETAYPRILSRKTTTTTTIESTNLGFDLNAAPMANRNYATWVRVGFSYTF